jgi:hypothetical protein
MPRATIQVSFELPPGITPHSAADLFRRTAERWLDNSLWLGYDDDPQDYELHVEVIEEPKP